MKSIIILIFLILSSSIQSYQDFYDVLGIDKSTSAKDMKSAYRKLSQKYHPDKNQGDKSAQEKFILINKAYETLSDPEKRKIYDIYGEEGLSKQGQMNESHKQRGQNAQIDIEFDLEDFYNGATRKFSINKNVVCEKCHGTGGKLGETKQCPKCNGRGQVLEEVNTGMGFTFQVQNTCNRCRGRGVVFKETCPHCNGRRVNNIEQSFTVTVEKGMKHKEKIVFPREAEQHPDITPGDLIVNLIQRPHHFFIDRKDDDLYANLHLSLKEALLGYSKSFKHLDGRVVKIEKKGTTQPFEVRLVEEEGMPIHNFYSSKGKLFLTQVIKLPSSLTEEEKRIVEELFK